MWERGRTCVHRAIQVGKGVGGAGWIVAINKSVGGVLASAFLCLT